MYLFFRESDDPNELSLFETLRETIYSEVATLISQNENRPHYLIELFKELQLLTTDYLRQRVLYDIKDVVSKYLVDENTDSVSAVSSSMHKYKALDNCFFNQKVFIVFLFLHESIC